MRSNRFVFIEVQALVTKIHLQSLPTTFNIPQTSISDDDDGERSVFRVAAFRGFRCLPLHRSW